jgi:hypothetical protein
MFKGYGSHITDDSRAQQPGPLLPTPLPPARPLLMPGKPLPPSRRSTPSLLLHRRDKALEESQKFLKAEIAHLRQLLVHYHEEIRATKELVKGTSLGLKQAELSFIKMKEEEMRIQGEWDAYNSDSDWVHNTTEAALSPPTSMATDTRTARRNFWRGCTCPSHQAIYNDWPTQNAELTISRCMRTCMYCGSDFQEASTLRKHIKRVKYARRNLSVI